MGQQVAIPDKVIEHVFNALNSCDHLGDEDLFVTIETAKPQPVTKADGVIAKALARDLPIFKTQEERYVLAVVLEPLKEMGKTDTQNDMYSASEVREAAYRYMENYGQLGLQHMINVTGRVKLVENHITRVDEKIDKETVKAGTWLMGLRVVDDELWAKVKDGSLTGLSIGGVAQRTPVE